MRLRRAEANRQLGRYEPAYADLSAVLDSVLPRTDPIVRKAHAMKLEMRKVEKKSNDEMRAPIANCIAHGTFSNDRLPDDAELSQREEAKARLLEESPQMMRMRRMHHQRNLALSSDEQKEEGVGSVSISSSSSHRKPNPQFCALELEVVEAIQNDQLALFSSKGVQASLERMRFDAGLEQSRFFLRLKPFKLEVQKSILLKYGFEATSEGLGTMERSIAAHMNKGSEVGVRGKALMLLIVGDVWDSSEQAP